MPNDFFPPKPEINPLIYAYELIDVKTHVGLLKIGYTTRSAQGRISEQLKTSRVQYKIVFEEPALRDDGSFFTDTDVHHLLRKNGITHVDGEWFKCTLKDIKAAIVEIRSGVINDDNRTLHFNMRPEQEEAVKKTMSYFKSFNKENKGKTPHFLWNAKMRFGKTFATYQLARQMGWKRLLILTFKPAVQSAWEHDLLSHVDFKGWKFVSKKNGISPENFDRNTCFVCFGSFQDYLGKNEVGGIKPKNEWVHAINWDCVVFDEYHFGAWRENAKELFEAEGKKELEFGEGEGMEYFEEENMPITTNAYLYLSGTPFRAIGSGEFIEEQIYNWTYSDEQRAKENWQSGFNPYAALPRMVMLTYQLPDSLREVANMNIEGFRNLNQDIQTIINKSELIKKAKKDANEKPLTKAQKKQLSDEEKEYKSLRKQIQEKLIKFATRIPVFMYLTDYRERSLKDVITQLEPGLFKKITGLTVKDFELLVGLGVFNSALMNDAVYKFKRYEDSSLAYAGINRHAGEDIGLYDTVLSAEDYRHSLGNEE